MNLKQLTYKAAGVMIRKLKLYNYIRLRSDNRPAFPYPVVFMCGDDGLRYINACLTSIYLSWDKLPEIIIVSDGTPLARFEKELVKWPRKLEVIPWETCANYFRDKGNADLFKYAVDEVFGKKMVSILYHAEKHPTLYCDTDVLWYSTPREVDMTVSQPFIQMSTEAEEACYSRDLLEHLGEQRCWQAKPFNAGLMYLNGDFSVYPKWKELCHHLGHAPKNDKFAEQTTFAILNNHFNAERYWSRSEVMIKTDDIYNLKYTGKYYPRIAARHYVYTRPTAFWRDFAFMCAQKNNWR